MKPERRPLSRFTLPIRAFADRFALGALVMIAAALFTLSRADVAFPQALVTGVTDLLMPVLRLVAEPVATSRQAVDAVGAVAAVYEENQRLEAENDRLLQWQAVAQQLALENQALRRMVTVAERQEHPTTVVGRVVADGGGPFVHTVLIDVGMRHGVREGMAAVNGAGLVGRVIAVGQGSARILLLTDFNSRIPVMVEPSRDQAILAGDNSRLPTLTFLPLNPRLSLGDRVVTSGRGGLLPPGLTIGTVRTIDDERALVRTAVDWDRLEHLHLLDYAPVLPPEALEEVQRELYGPPLPPGFAPTPDPSAGPPTSLDPVISAPLP